MTTAHEADEGESYLTPAQARRRLGVSPRTYRRYVASGVLVPHHRTPLGHARFTEASLQVQRPRRSPGPKGEPATP